MTWSDFAEWVLARDGAVNEPSTPSTERPKAGATGRAPRPDASRFLVPPSITLRATPARANAWDFGRGIPIPSADVTFSKTYKPSHCAKTEVQSHNGVTFSERGDLYGWRYLLTSESIPALSPHLSRSRRSALQRVRRHREW